MVLAWSVIFVILVVIEIATVGLASVWFALGAVAALIAAALGAALWLQVTLFLVVSLLSLALTRPLLVKKLAPRRSATNFDRSLEMVGTVTEEVDNLRDTGTVHVDGKDWTARSLDGRVLPVGTPVRAQCIEGVKLIVLPAELPAGAAPPW